MKKVSIIFALVALVFPVLAMGQHYAVQQDSCVTETNSGFTVTTIHFSVSAYSSATTPVCRVEFQPSPQPAAQDCIIMHGAVPNINWHLSQNSFDGGDWHTESDCIEPGSYRLFNFEVPSGALGCNYLVTLRDSDQQSIDNFAFHACDPTVSVESTSWGAIKAIYR